MDMFDLENDLPDELMSSPWTSDNNDLHTNDTAATGPGPGPGTGPDPGGPLIGAQDTNSNTGLHRHVPHSIMQHQVSNFSISCGGALEEETWSNMNVEPLRGLRDRYFIGPRTRLVLMVANKGSDVRTSALFSLFPAFCAVF